MAYPQSYGGVLPPPVGGDGGPEPLGDRWPLATPSPEWRLGSWRSKVRAILQVNKISSGDKKQPRIIVFQTPTLLMMKNQGGKYLVTRVMHLNEIREVVHMQSKILLRATPSSTRDWLFEIVPDNRNHPRDKALQLPQMLRDFHSIYSNQDLPVTEQFNIVSNNLKKKPNEGSLTQRLRLAPRPIPEKLEQAASPPAPPTPALPVPQEVEPVAPPQQEEPQPEPVDPNGARTYHIYPRSSPVNPGVSEVGFAPGTSENKPPRIKHVRGGGPAADSQLWRDDDEPAPIVTHVNGEPVQELGEFLRAIEEGKKRPVVKVTVIPGRDDISSTVFEEDEEFEEFDEEEPYGEEAYGGPGGVDTFGRGLESFAPSPDPKLPSPPRSPVAAAQTERPLVPPRRGKEGGVAKERPSGSRRDSRESSRRTRRKGDRFWRNFVQSYDAQMKHWERIEPRVMVNINRGIDGRVVPLDFEGEALLRHAPQQQQHSAGASPAGRAGGGYPAISPRGPVTPRRRPGSAFSSDSSQFDSIGYLGHSTGYLGHSTGRVSEHPVGRGRPLHSTGSKFDFIDI